MKDYTNNPEDKKSFITHYDNLGEEILVHYADGSEKYLLREEIPYIESRMIKQINDVTKDSNALYEEGVLWTTGTIALGGVSIAALTKYIADFCKTGILDLRSDALFVSAFSTIVTILLANSLKEYREKISDIKKHKYYLKNSKKINRYTYNKDLYKGTNIKPTIDSITINKVHSLDMKTLEILVNNANSIHEQRNHQLSRKRK